MNPHKTKKLKPKTPQLYIYIFFFKKGEQLFKTNWAVWWGWGAVLQKGAENIPLGTKNKHNTKKITTNAPAWVRSLQRTDCPILKLAFFFLPFFLSFFSIFFFCCCCFSTCTIKLYHLQPEPATARPSCLWMVHTLYKDCLEKIAIGRKIRTRVGKTMPQRGQGQGKGPSSSLSPSLSQNKPSTGGQKGGPPGPHNQPPGP